MTEPKKPLVVDVNLEEAAEESARDRRDLARLHGDLEELLKHEDAMRVPLATRRLIDGGVDAVVVAKTLLIGDREGTTMYRLSARSPAIKLEELAAQRLFHIAIRDVELGSAALMMCAGAVWIATQFKLDRSLLRALVFAAARRPKRDSRIGYGVVDIVDNHGIANRAWLLDAIDNAKLPDFATLQYSPGGDE